MRWTSGGLRATRSMCASTRGGWAARPGTWTPDELMLGGAAGRPPSSTRSAFDGCSAATNALASRMVSRYAGDCSVSASRPACRRDSCPRSDEEPSAPPPPPNPPPPPPAATVVPGPMPSRPLTTSAPMCVMRSEWGMPRTSGDASTPPTPESPASRRLDSSIVRSSTIEASSTARSP